MNSAGIRSPPNVSGGVTWVCAVQEISGRHAFFLSHQAAEAINFSFRYYSRSEYFDF